MFYGQCWKCGERWELGTASSCKCPEETTIEWTDSSIEVLRLSKDGVWANPDIPVDKAAKLVLEAIDHNIKVLVEKAVADEREECAKECEGINSAEDYYGERPELVCAEAIRARSNT
jgi:hypothetical protein